MGKVYYIGFYNGRRCRKRRNCAENVAATVKMDFIIDALKDLGYQVHLISVSIGAGTGFFGLEHVKVDEQEEHDYIPYFALDIRNRAYLAGKTAGFFLKMYALLHLKKDDIVITYHSLAYHQFWTRLHKLIGFRWIPQVEEIYCLSRKDYQDEKYLEKEVRMFSSGDGFLFVNDIMAKKYAKGKPYAVSYGNYNVYAEKEAFSGEKIGVVYTGIINRDRGAFKVIDAMQYLPGNYELHILGFGSEDNMRQMWEHIKDANRVEERVFFEGTKVGKEYTEFLLKHQIGISIMDTSAAISENAFPSKILAYLGHSLFVVSSRCPSIVESKVANLLYFCDDSAQDIARAIHEVPVYDKNNSITKLNQLKKEFLDDLSNVLSDGNQS